MQRAFVFPGQGSQSVGMLAEFAASDAVIGETFTEASAALGYDLWKLVSAGPAERLNETVQQQPAMLTADIATWRLWQKLGGPMPDLVCGHSLGEFSALVAAGALDFFTAVRLVRTRAQLMQEAVPAGEGAIAAVLGLEDAQVEAACIEAAQGQVVQAVNYNSPGQVVIAGNAAAVDRALAACKARGARRAMLIPMSVPAHSALMVPAAGRFAESLDATAFAAPRIAFWSPVDGSRHAEPSGLRDLLRRQLASPVRWSALVQRLAAEGISQFVECGPGKVLTGLIRRIDKRPEIQCLALQDPDSMQTALATMTSTG
jgi:[acyl-carrier-protein] S-malonyltransferase